MAIWEIRIVDQPPIKVEITDGRNLSKEFTQFCHDLTASRPPKWKFWAKPQDLYWVVNEDTKLHVQMVAAILICKKVRGLRREIGFHVIPE